MEQQENYDLLIVADATYSMSDYLASLQISLPQIISLSALTGCFSRIGLLGYRDYCDGDLLEWSGWLHQSSDVEQEQPDLIAKAKSMEPLGGGDLPEATKTALAKAYQVMRTDATTILLLYTDAPPHVAANGDLRDTNSNYGPEKKALTEPRSYDGFGPDFVDWVSACKKLRSGEKKTQVFCILKPSMAWQRVGHYNYISTMTGGPCIYLKDKEPATISKVTIEVLLAWMGVEKAGTSDDAKKTALPAVLSRYIDIEKIKKLKDENDSNANQFFLTSSSTGGNTSDKLISANIVTTLFTPEALKKYLPKKTTPVSDFAKSYATDSEYRVIAVEHLSKIINSDVRAVSLNPVFGSLWRAVCNDRNNDAREGLISAFGLQIERISNADEKASMKAWLEESYDYSAEVKDIIAGVPEEARFPCVCLDPTLSFVRSGVDANNEDDPDRPITSFRRDELLEIGRSCDFRILRRLGRILTRLTYVESAADMPEHISATTDDEIPKVPMALASKEHGRQFWRILLHIIVPGTMLSARPAALLAALSLRLGVEPLTQAADREMLVWRNKWNDVDVPETWNVGCLSLLLDADLAYHQRQESLKTPSGTGDAAQKSSSLLKPSDRSLFERLVGFRMLELNLDTTLTAEVGWTPQKTVVPLGPVVVCKSCHYPRSVTIMGRSGTCGHCLDMSYDSPEVREKCIHIRASKEDDEKTPATWVECFVRTCRAQYVVYHLEALNVRPKCYYCRSQKDLPESKRSENPAPWVECTQCLNRMIWPTVYRPHSFSKSDFICPPCTSERKTRCEVETTAKKLSTENTMTWLVQDLENPGKDPFTGRSLYHTISTIGPSPFLSRIQLFPPARNPLTLNGKLVRNPTTLTSALQDLVSQRQTSLAPCSLCFSNFRPAVLNPACGRHGCLQRICRDCLSAWYGLNAPGRIINTAALSCPFCRRKPAARTLAKYGMGIHAVGNLATAVQEKGRWIYAWCYGCGVVKQYMERVCVAGAPAEVDGWTCDDCREGRERLLRTAKPCPGCGTATEKVGGCDHIECIVRGCGAHWCFYCGGRFTEVEIYRHMSSAHGGYYG